jgi:hypothetical protein
MKLLLTIALCLLVFKVFYEFVYLIIEIKDSERRR